MIRVNVEPERYAAGSGSVAAPARTFDEATFAGLVEGHRHELQVHCYRMLGSLDDAEDLVQETFLRAWRKRDTFQGRSTFRAWLYRIATNACLDFLERNPRQPRPRPGTPDAAAPTSPDNVAWLQPFPDRMIEPAVPSEAEPDAAVVAKETIELAFLVAIQHLPAKQRAVLIMRDVLGWPASEASAVLGLTVASVNSALQRARATLKEHLPPHRLEWAPSQDPTKAERTLLQRYMGVFERADARAMAELLHEDVRVTMPMLIACTPGAPDPLWLGRDPFVTALGRVFDPSTSEYIGQWRSLPTRANRQPAVAHYVRRPGGTEHQAQILDVLRVVEGRIVEITTFGPERFPAFGLPPSL
ncbi:RNA polymerase subunit sigma-70 [Phytohabitans flavus]|uniref:RNA polymerase sigma factor n=1 Tax=Phytohabitans flavus TaxID=1076124 RepID=A0A6F8XJS9_9ACTN|nr:RNA polymerase subunit sigma-70 [Phytohabitans flavus]BCB74067.1 RNA polymerase sigma factor [Phytohabitans flavus]